MPPRTQISRIQDLLSVISHLTPRVFYPYDDLVKLLVKADPDSDGAFRSRVLEAAVDLGILGKPGANYLLRRAPSPADFQSIAQDEGLSGGIAPSGAQVDELSQSILAIPGLERRLSLLMAEVADLKATKVMEGHWLILDEDLMPRTTRDHLRGRAIKMLSGGGHKPSVEEVHRQMVGIAAAAIVHALKESR